eukprot:158215-Pleurochrysis_carterae.AAC.1
MSNGHIAGVHKRACHNRCRAAWRRGGARWQSGASDNRRKQVGKQGLGRRSAHQSAGPLSACMRATPPSSPAARRRSHSQHFASTHR